MRLQTAFTARASLTKQTQNVKDPTLRKRNAVRTGVEQTKQQSKQVSSKSAAGLELMLQKEQIAERKLERKRNSHHSVCHTTRFVLLLPLLNICCIE